jgi:hypothetical protein
VASHKTLYSWAKDAAGNISTALAATITITLPDVTKPIVTGLVVPLTSTSKTITVTTFTATDNAAVTGYMLTGTATAPTATATGWSSTASTSYTFVGIPDGVSTAKTLYSWAKDAAGNVSSSAIATTTITLPDVTKPIVTAFTIPATGTSLTVPVSTLTATDNAAVTGYLLTATATAPATIDAGWNATKPTRYSFIGISEGIATPKTLYAWAKDAAGNVSLSLSAITIITLSDVTQPTITGFTLPANGTSLTIAVSTLTATDNVAVTGYLLTSNATTPLSTDAAWSVTKSETFTFSNIPDGVATQKTLYAWAKDAAGFVSTSATASTTITLPDLTAPTITAFTIPASAPLTVPVTTFTATDNVAVSSYCITETNSSTACSWSATAPTNYTFTTAGSKTLYAWAKDGAGNISLSISATVTVTSKPGDSDGDGTVSIAEVQSAINMFLGLKAAEGYVDMDGAGGVSIAEVQKVINSFLGL